ncbi:transcriptional regulator [Catellatospora methionotrophica]|uniref:Transcriptional regulator n=1 Tax=Catellatospora methionotrophica TaxID=121620 RepID=A0A8J3L468_9ACTN|nr:helix-turn-helix domain-containing protein [Catellatospora methionotrophica]GIG12125.1 transcriptional regulator [Catellatospora methionotrophica]
MSHDPVALTDPIAMRALAHPLRLALLRQLTEAGPATATQLAERTGVSAPSASYHLKQLAKYGFVEDADPPEKGRDRPWRARGRGMHWSAGAGESTEFVAASRLLRDEFTNHALTSLRSYWRDEDTYDASWQEAAFVLADTAAMTADEVQEVNEELRQLIARFRDRPDGQRPKDARPVRLFGFGVPEQP